MNKFFYLLMILSLSFKGAWANSPSVLKEKFLAPDKIKGFAFEDFYGTKDYLTLNGVAELSLDDFSTTETEKTILRLTPRIPNSEGHIAGSAFIKFPFKAFKENYAFSTFFRYRVSASHIYDGSGMVFMVQSDDRYDKAIGKCSYCMGYAGAAHLKSVGIRPSVAVEFDIQRNGSDEDYNMVGLDLNGDLNSIVLRSGAFGPNSRSGISEMPYTDTTINNGIPWNVWIDYDGRVLEVRSSQQRLRRKATVHIRRPINIGDILTAIRDKKEADEPIVYIGFSSDPGLYPAYTDVLEWHFKSYYEPYGNYILEQNK